MNVLITGSSGFLGSHLAEILINSGCTVFGMDVIPGRVALTKFILGPVEIESLLEFNAIPMDFIFHCAGGSSVGISFEKPNEEFKKTVDSTSTVLDYIRTNQKNCVFIYPSSASVYGKQSIEILHEDLSKNPRSPYGLHKSIAEELILSYKEFFGLQVHIFRLFSLYGIGLKKQIVWDACEKMANRSAVFSGAGSEVRDFILVNEVVNYFSSLVLGKVRPESIVNLGTGIGTSTRKLVSLIQEAYEYKDDVVFNGVSRPGDPDALVADTKRLFASGPIKMTPIEIGIKEVVNWYKSAR